MLNSQTSRRESGFTLVELLIVVLIIGILATIAIPVFNGQRNKAKNSASQTAVRTAMDAASAAYTDGETYAGLTSATLNGLETSLTGAATGGAMTSLTPGSGNPTQILVTNIAATGVTVGAAPTTKIVLCSVSKGDSWYCAEGNAGVWTYAKGTTALANANVTADFAATSW